MGTKCATPNFVEQQPQKKICIKESDFTGTKEYLNQMYSLLLTKYKKAEMFTLVRPLVFQLADAKD